MSRMLPLLGIFLLVIIGHAGAASAFDACAKDARAQYTPILQSQAKAKTLLFRAERCGVKESFIFGTMHSDDPEVNQRAAPVLARLPQLRSAAFEYLEPVEASELMQRAMIDPEGSLSKHLTPAEWQRLQDTLGKPRGIPDLVLQRLRPWAASVMLQMPKLEHNGVILDDSIKAEVQKRGIPLVGLETMAEQLGIFEGMTQAQQIVMLKDTLSDTQDLERMNRELESAYRQGDLPRIDRLGAEGFANIQDKALKDYLQDALLTRRNQRMAERAQPELAQGGLLIAVGALHLPGKEGILARLEQAGYFIFPVQ